MKHTKIIFTLLITIPLFSTAQDSSLMPKTNNQFYFPNGISGDSSIQEINDFRNSWYSEFLLALQEPKIYMDTSQNEIYRFTWLRTFDNPISVRIEKNANTYLVFWKQSSGQGGYEPGTLIMSGHKTIYSQIWNSFLTTLNESGFWLLSTNENGSGMDGAQWILEAKTSQKYHVVDRWSPNKNSKYFKVCDFLLKLTDLRIKSGDKY